MLAIALFVFFRDSRNIPITEDWFLVGAFTGHEPHLLSWLWALNGEHRVPLPKLLMVLILKATHGNYRAVQLLDITLLAGIAATLVLTAKKFRGGRYSYTDAFFPLLMLHLAHIENLIWAWQITFVCSIVLAFVLLIAIIEGNIVEDTRTAWTAGIALPLMPFTGATGLLFVPLLGIWFLFLAFSNLRSAAGRASPAWALIGCSAASFLFTALYFVDYHPIDWGAPELSLSGKLTTAGQALSIGFGLAAIQFSTLAISVSVLLVTATLILSGYSVARRPQANRDRAVGLAVFFLASVTYLAVLGFKRGSVVIYLYRHWPSRYVLLATPMLAACYFIWHLYGPTRIRGSVQAGLTAALFVLAPLNAAYGNLWIYWVIHKGADVVRSDLLAGLSAAEIAKRNRPFIPKWLDAQAAAVRLMWLHDAGVQPFANVNMADRSPEPPSSPSAAVGAVITTTVLYTVPGAKEVYLLWGVDGWRPLPRQLWPARTELSRSLLKTALDGLDGRFQTTISVPVGAHLDFGFLIARCNQGANFGPVFDSPHEQPAANTSKVVFASQLSCEPDGSVAISRSTNLLEKEFRFRDPDASEVFLSWGVDGWHLVAPSLRPAGTIVVDNTLRTPMTRHGEWFTALVKAPAGETINYGILFTGQAGLTHLTEPIWQPGASDISLTDARPIIIEPRPDMLMNDLSFMPKTTTIVAAIAGFLILWALLFTVYDWSVRRVSTANKSS